MEKILIKSDNKNAKPIFTLSYWSKFLGSIETFFLSFENSRDRILHPNLYHLTVETKDYNAMIDRKVFFDQPVKK